MDKSHDCIVKYSARSVIISPSQYLSKDLFLIDKQFLPYISTIVIPQGKIIDRIEKLAYDILQDFGDKDITIVAVMKGSLKFLSYLETKISEIRRHENLNNYGKVTFEYIQLSSYKGESSSGQVEIRTKDTVFEELKGKDVLIVEDLFDSGLSMNFFIEYLKKFEIRSIKIAILFIKLNPLQLSYNVSIDYVGFIIPNDFIIGFGMDYNQLFRDLNHLCLLNKEGIQKFRNFY